MIKMEAELTALREELSSRAKNNNGTGNSNGSNGSKGSNGSSNGTKHELTNHSNVSNGNESENPATDIASVIKKPEKNNTDIKEEEKVD